MSGLFAGMDALARPRGDGLRPELRALLDRDRLARSSPNVVDFGSFRYDHRRKLERAAVKGEIIEIPARVR